MATEHEQQSPKWRLNTADGIAICQELVPIALLAAVMRVGVLYRAEVVSAVGWLGQHSDVTLFLAMALAGVWKRFAAGHPVVAEKIRDRVSTLKELAHDPTTRSLARTALGDRAAGVSAVADTLARLQVDAASAAGDSDAGVVDRNRDRTAGSGRAARNIRIESPDGSDATSEGVRTEPQQARD